jgi:hypothetical protein
MAVIQRPVKTYGTRTYAAEVAAAPGNLDTILATEVDGDLDTMYGAWNSGADTVNIKDGAVTNAKLAPDAKLWTDDGTSLVAANGRVIKTAGMSGVGSLVAGAGANTMRLITPGTLSANYYYTGTAWARDDTTKAGWSVVLDTANDVCGIVRDAGQRTNQLLIDSGGHAVLAGRFRSRNFSQGIAGGSAHPVVNGQTLGILYESVWFDSAGGNPPALGNAGYLFAPPFYDLMLVWCSVNFDTNGGFGCSLGLQYSAAGSGWVTFASTASRFETSLTVAGVFPAPPNYYLRSIFTNASGINPVTISGRYFLAVGLGSW